MKGFFKLPIGCLTVLLLVLAVWVAVQFFFLPAAERDMERGEHTLKDITDQFFHH